MELMRQVMRMLENTNWFFYFVSFIYAKLAPMLKAIINDNQQVPIAFIF
tara:strand:- start:9 stop:155 length:147 start_codon:yes stop_codon:yes gene_type:complete